METLYAIAALEFLAWCFFFKQMAFIHAVALLIFVKIFFPIIKSALLHVCWRIPRAIIKREFKHTARMHLSWWGIGKKPNTNYVEPAAIYDDTPMIHFRESTIPRPSQINEIVARESAKIDAEFEKLTGR